MRFEEQQDTGNEAGSLTIEGVCKQDDSIDARLFMHSA